MEFRVLGPLEVRRDDTTVAIPGGKPRALLAVLLLHADQPVSAERLALAVWGAQGAKRKFATLMLVLTLILGSIFVGVKGYEYAEHIHEGLFPGSHFTYTEANPALTRGVQMFMTFYFTMTGLHALHMVIGAGLLLYFIRRAWRGDFGPEYYSPIEIMGLYWHFVDIVWIFLFPLLYLV